MRPVLLLVLVLLLRTEHRGRRGHEPESETGVEALGWEAALSRRSLAGRKGGVRGRAVGVRVAVGKGVGVVVGSAGARSAGVVDVVWRFPGHGER